jgi:hypothetical protein
MNLVPISLACPQCGSSDVLYSCKPECCFNHVCNNCYTTFELETERVGETVEELVATSEPDSTNPAAPCARCGECRVFACEDGSGKATTYVCISCKALLRILLVHVAQG